MGEVPLYAGREDGCRGGRIGRWNVQESLEHEHSYPFVACITGVSRSYATATP